ncbi:hypothetical protein HBA54_26380 [Pelagibius litoralis]|uniref:Uncharacterized protein n=1 Tax=Pelagibius litoralis TaxID=374515 RepID=A0A967F339_9PROT|nr:hypothetical protein [Pelagibius litoralis]NIA72122.1 hypothetical protein [Pelagibius litoralis]
MANTAQPGSRHPSRPRLCLSLGLMLAVSACDQGPATNTRFMHPSGAQEFLIAATRNQGPLHLEIHGQAFAASPALEALIAGTMEKAIQTRRLRVATEPSEAEDPRFKLLLLFNAPASTEVLALCKNQPDGGEARSDGRIEVLAAFCNGERLVSAVQGWVEEAEAPDSDRFQQLIRQVARDLFSPRRKGE